MTKSISKFLFALAALLFPFTAKVFAIYPPYQNNFLPIYQHSLYSTQTDGQMIEIDDGSIWKINYYHRNTVRHWRSGDILEISQTYNTRGERFWITNKTLGSYVPAELSLSPIVDHPCAHQLSYVDRGVVSIMSASGLESRYVIDSRDVHLIANWQLNQLVIVGVNNISWFGFFEKSDVILINVDQNNYVRATLL